MKTGAPRNPTQSVLGSTRGARAAELALAVFAMAVVLTLPASAQPAPTLKTVTISAPVGTVQQPFRTSFAQLAIAFSHDGGGIGLFIAQSQGADVNGTNFLVNEPSGTVGAYFNTAGLKTVSVRVTAQPTSVTVVSQPTYLVYDNVPPTLTVTQLRVDPRLPWEPFDPARTYYTSADALGIRGFVNDGPLGTPADQIAIKALVGATPVTGRADAAGQFEMSLPLTGLPDGPVELSLSAADKMSDGSRVNESKGPRIRLGE